jgi:Mn2+/Fe2+ NRAMP family transporter
MVAGGPSQLYVVFFALLSLTLQIFVPFPRYAPILKWLTASLLGYVATVLVVSVPWEEATVAAFVPHVQWKSEYLSTLVAVLGTTISPYLFFWQASQEVEEQRAAPGDEPLREAPDQAIAHLARIKFDTWIGMVFSNLIAACIMVTTAATLNAHGITNVDSAEQAAAALRPIAGNFAFLLFAASIIGTGLLAVPVLAGSAAYAVAEARRWPIGLGLSLSEARNFYGVLAAATLVGVALGFSGMDPIRMLLLSAIVNGVIAVPIMAVMMMLSVRPDVMGPFTVSPRLRALGWLSTLVMAAAVVAMFATL